MPEQDQFEHGGNIYKMKLNTGRESIMDFSANINPMGLSKAVRKAIIDNVDDIIHYPDVSMNELKNKLSEIYDISVQQIIIGNGAVELIYILCHVLMPQNVLITAPTFSEYERASRSVGAKITYCTLAEEDNFELSLQKIIIAMKNKDLLFLCNPNNPTGTLIAAEDLTLIIEHAEANGCFVVIDESFMDFIANSGDFSAKPLLKNNHNLFVLHSLTKFFALPGLRLGFAVCADNEVIKRMYLNKDPWNVNCLAQKAGLAALEDEKYRRRSRNYTRSEINYLYEELLHMDKLKVYKPTVNYILINIKKTGIKSKQFKLKMLDKGIAVRDCANYPGLSGDFIRIAVRTREENDKLLDAMEDVLK
ncbi:threonine-phosphate decarboxylase CobD [Pectinatus sottacetonis]|uniref:threonine-phosphate decarboxylase CobD n=1 Tax=Pectinatus sottacetonis TaxID=1002795 RepID=UPI0018C6CE28|nr:threonine-phosphate decarboxylase CobD [Pectinatus sottacetonis]